MTYSVYELIKSSKNFPVKVFVAPIATSTFHWHNEYELIGILKGRICVHAGSESVSLKEGDLYLVNARVIHAIRCVDGEPNLCMLLQMSPELFLTEPGDTKEIRFYLDSTRGEEEPDCGYGYFYTLLAEIVNEALKEDSHSPFRIRAKVCRMISDLFDFAIYDECYRDAVTQTKQELAVSVIEYIEKSEAEDKVLEQTCRQFGLSRKSLDRNLKSIVGVTGKELLENLRIEKAKALLKNTDKNMNYILDACGFGSENTFYRVFRRETGLTPNEFRQKGQIEQYDQRLKGYLDYEVSEVQKILEKVLKQEEE